MLPQSVSSSLDHYLSCLSIKCFQKGKGNMNNTLNVTFTSGRKPLELFFLQLSQLRCPISSFSLRISSLFFFFVSSLDFFIFFFLSGPLISFLSFPFLSFVFLSFLPCVSKNPQSAYFQNRVESRLLIHGFLLYQVGCNDFAPLFLRWWLPTQQDTSKFCTVDPPVWRTHKK